MSVIVLHCWHWIIWVILYHGALGPSNHLHMAQLAMLRVLCISQVSWAGQCSRHNLTWKREWEISGLVYSVLQPAFIRAPHLGIPGPWFP